MLQYHPKLASDPHFKDYVLFHEYFHGDTGRGVGASHQTGWTGLIAKLLQPRAGAEGAQERRESVPDLANFADASLDLGIATDEATRPKQKQASQAKKSKAAGKSGRAA